MDISVIELPGPYQEGKVNLPLETYNAMLKVYELFDPARLELEKKAEFLRGLQEGIIIWKSSKNDVNIARELLRQSGISKEDTELLLPLNEDKK